MIIFTKKVMLSILCVLFLMLSCGESKEKKVDENGNIVSSAVPESKFESTGFIMKYNKYIDFGNRFDSQANDSYQRYFKWADIEKGPKNAKRVGGVSTLPEASLKDLKTALGLEEDIEGVDGLMKVVYDKAVVLYNVFEDADGYYDKEDYKDDDFAKGEELHKQIVAAYDGYFTAYSAMYKEFAVLQDELFKFDAAKFKEENLLLKYNLMMSLHFSENILDVIGDLDAQELKKMDMAKFDAEMTEFRTHFDALDKLAKDKSNITKEYGDSSIKGHYISSFIKKGNDFIVQTRKLKERIEKNNFNYGSIHPNIPASGSPHKLNEIYSKMVGEYNSLN